MGSIGFVVPPWCQQKKQGPKAIGTTIGSMGISFGGIVGGISDINGNIMGYKSGIIEVGASSHIMSHPMAVSLPTATVGPDKRMRVYVSATYLHMFAIHMLYTKS